MDTLVALVLQLGSLYAIFIPVVNKVLVQHWIQHATYNQLIGKLLNSKQLPQELLLLDNSLDNKAEEAPLARATKMTVNQQHLKQAWDTSKVLMSKDWRKWLQRMAVEFMHKSPSHVLRACCSLADVYQLLAYTMFNAAFVSCWTELYKQYQSDLVKAIETAFEAPEVLDNIVHMLLNLAKCMEHDDKALPINICTLGDWAYKFHSYAKVFHYKEAKFLTDPSLQVIKSLIDINTKLQQLDAAFGALTYAQEHLDMMHHDEWYKKLHHWEEALFAYNHKVKLNPDNYKIAFGRMQCLHALGEWEHLSDLVQQKWHNADAEDRRHMAPLATTTTWSCSQWDTMDNYISAMRLDSSEWSMGCLNPLPPI
ncbi:phosphatidylinositol kinase-related protein kinase tor1 [Thecaphora frezii]